MLSSSSSPTAAVSPIASPGRRSPPSPGSRDAAAAKPERSRFAQSRKGGGPATTRASPSANSRKPTSSSGAAAVRLASRRRVAPIPAGRAVSPPKTSTGVDSASGAEAFGEPVSLPRTSEPRVATATSLAATGPSRAPGAIRSEVTTSTLSARPWPWPASSSTPAGCRSGARTATTVHTRATAARHAAACAAHARAPRRPRAPRDPRPSTVLRAAAATWPATAPPATVAPPPTTSPAATTTPATAQAPTATAVASDGAATISHAAAQAPAAGSTRRRSGPARAARLRALTASPGL